MGHIRGDRLLGGSRAVKRALVGAWLKWQRIRLRVHKTRGSASVPGREDPRRRAWQPAPVLLPGEAHGQRSLLACGPWGHEWDTAEYTKGPRYSVLKFGFCFVVKIQNIFHHMRISHISLN